MEKYTQSPNRNEQADTQYHDPDKLSETPQAQKLTQWKKEPTLPELSQDLEFAREETNDQESNVAGWLNLRNTTGPEGPKKAKVGRSSVQPKLIRKHNEWRYPALSEPFLNTERMFEVSPRTHEDVPKAKQNQILLNWQFDTKIDKVDFIDRYVRTAVDEGSVIVRVGWETEYGMREVEETVFDYFPPESDEEAAIVNEAVNAMVNVPHEFVNLPEDLQASAEMSYERQELLVAKANGVAKAVREVMVKNCPSLRIIDVRNLFIDPTCDGDWEKAQYMIHTYEATESELKANKGFKNLDKVNFQENYVQAKQGDQDHHSNTPQTDSRSDNTKKKILVYEYWGLYDIHDNGVMVPIVVTWIGNEIIQMEENPFPDDKPPFVIVPYMPILKSVFGEADASLLQDNQRIIGAVTRGMIDLMGRSANAQTAWAKGALDPVNKRRATNGEDFEFNPIGDIRNTMQQLTFPEIPNSAHEMVSVQNTEAESLTGVKAFSGGISGDAYGSVATGIRGALDSAATREMSILRRLAMGMKKIGQKIIAMNAVYLSEEEVVRVTNEEFVTVKRSELAGNFDLKVDISTASVDEQRAQDLGFVLQTVGPDMDLGMKKIVLSKIADLKRMPDLAEQMRNYEPQPDPIAQKRAELELRELEAKIMEDEARAKLALAQARKAEVEAADIESGVQHERDIEKMVAQSRGNRSAQVTKAILDGETGSGNIEAAVGYNKLIEAEEERETAPRVPTGGAFIPQNTGQPQGLAPLGTV